MFTMPVDFSAGWETGSAVGSSVGSAAVASGVAVGSAAAVGSGVDVGTASVGCAPQAVKSRLAASTKIPSHFILLFIA